MKLSQERIDSISNLSEDQINYDSVFTAFDNCGSYLDHLISVHDNEQLRSVYKEFNHKITEFYTKIFLNSKLWSAIKKATEKIDLSTLTAEQKRFIEETVLTLKLNGADLKEEQKDELK